MPSQRQTIDAVATQKNIGGNFNAQVAIAARALIDNNNIVQLDPDDLPTTVVNLTGATGAGPALFSAGKIVTPYTPLTAFSIAANALSKDETVYLTPAGTLATGTFTFPTDATSRIGQILRLVSTQTQTALTISSSGLTLKGTAVTALTANTPVVWEKVAAATWLRLS